MILPGSDIRGDIMFLSCFGASWLIFWLFVADTEGPMTIVGGIFLTVTDFSYRLHSTKSDPEGSETGGTLMLFPAWAWGVFWVVLGIVYTIIEFMRGPA